MIECLWYLSSYWSCQCRLADRKPAVTGPSLSCPVCLLKHGAREVMSAPEVVCLGYTSGRCVLPSTGGSEGRVCVCVCVCQVGGGRTGVRYTIHMYTHTSVHIHTKDRILGAVDVLPNKRYAALLHCATLHCVTMHCATLHCVTLRCATLRCATLRCATLRGATLRCATLRCATLRCATLRLC